MSRSERLQRKRIYKLALKRVKTSEYSSICSSLSMVDKFIPSRKMDNAYPELACFKPEGKGFGQYWLPFNKVSNQVRQTILEFCVEMAKNPQ